MKRILIIAVLALIVVFPVAAASTSWAAGLNIGTGASLAGQFQMDKFKLNVNLGYGFVNKYVAADVFADYQVYEFNINKARFGGYRGCRSEPRNGEQGVRPGGDCTGRIGLPPREQGFSP